MRRTPRSAKIYAALMIVSIALTATPIVMLANRVTPTVLEMPFFLVWAILGPFLTFVFSALYTRVMNNDAEEPTHGSLGLDGEKS